MTSTELQLIGEIRVLSAVEPPYEAVVELEAADAARPGGARYLLRGSAWLSASLVTGAIGGVLFWILAAHVASSGALGRAAGLFTAVLFINYVTGFGFGVAIARFANDDSPSSRTTFAVTLILSAVTSASGAAAVFLMAAGRLTKETEGTTPTLAALFAATAVGLAMTSLVDVRLIGLRRWPWVFVRTTVVVVARLVLVALAPRPAGTTWLFLVVGGIPALSGVVAAIILIVTHPPRLFRRSAYHPHTRTALRFAGMNYLPSLAEQAPILFVPLMVAAIVSGRQNAQFYVAWSAVTFALLLVQAMGQVLLVEGGREGAVVDDQTRLILKISLTLLSVAAIAAFALRPLVEMVYGSDYAEAARLMPWLLAASIPFGVIATAVSRSRIENDPRATMWITGIYASAVLVPALILTTGHGIKGAAIAWATGVLLGAFGGASYLRRVLHRAKEGA